MDKDMYELDKQSYETELWEKGREEGREESRQALEEKDRVIAELMQKVQDAGMAGEGTPATGS